MGWAFEKIFQAVGKHETTMVSLLCGCIANIVLDPVLIFGLGPFPSMGIEGAALATGIGQTITLAIYLAVYRLRPIRVRIGRQYLAAARGLDGRLYAIGVPAVLNLALPSLLISALNAILAAYSQIYVVVLGVYYKLQTFLYLPASGVVQGMRPLIGYNFGAGERKRVSRIYLTALAMCGIVMAVGTGICLAVPGPLIALFTENPGDRCRRCGSAAYHQRRVCCFGRVGRLLGRAGGPRQRRAVAGDLAVPLHGHHHPGSVAAQPLLGRRRRMACILDHGGGHGGHRLLVYRRSIAEKRTET